MAQISIKNLKKVYASGSIGVANVNMEISDAEFTVLTGGAGAGKSSLIKALCGLEDVTEGEIVIDNVVVNDLQPKDRDIALVSKAIGLDAGLTVADNLCYGLRLRKMAKEDIAERVKEVARILDLTESLSKKPKNISGLERERVCIGRAIARRPKIIVLDDPFSDFNEETRKILCEDILKLQKRMKINFIYATKSAIEAVELADKIAYFEKSALVQYGSVAEIYDNPKSVPLARFIGNPPINLFIGKFDGSDGLKFVSDRFSVAVGDALKEAAEKYAEKNKKVQFGIRAEDLMLGNTLEGVQESISAMGENKILSFSVEGDSSAHYALVGNDFIFKKGESVKFDFDLSKANFFDFKSENNLI